MDKAHIMFRPLESETLVLLLSNYRACGNDPVDAYSRLLSAMLVAAAILDLSPAQVGHHTAELMVVAKKAVAAHPDIFGADQ